MNREIKFRAFVNGIMQYPKTLSEIANLGYSLSDDAILMQYTGLKDKNDKGIYEGDIVKLTEYYPLSDERKEWMGEIKFYSGCFWFDSEGRKENCWFMHNREDIEVIGNIYESEGLLENGKTN